MLLKRLDCFDDGGKEEAFKYLDKCITSFLEKKIKQHRKMLECQNVQKDHMEDLCTLRMVGLGLITVDEAKQRIINANVRVS